MYWLGSGPRLIHTVATGFYVIVDTQMSLVAGCLSREVSGRVEKILATLLAQLRDALTIYPCTALYSCNAGVVAGEYCTFSSDG